MYCDVDNTWRGGAVSSAKIEKWKERIKKKHKEMEEKRTVNVLINNGRGQ